MILQILKIMIGVTTLQIEGFCTKCSDWGVRRGGVTTLQIEGFCTNVLIARPEGEV